MSTISRSHAYLRIKQTTLSLYSYFYSLTLGDMTLMLGGQYTGVLMRGGTSSLEMTRVKVSNLLLKSK